MFFILFIYGLIAVIYPIRIRSEREDFKTKQDISYDFFAHTILTISIIFLSEFSLNLSFIKIFLLFLAVRLVIYLLGKTDKYSYLPNDSKFTKIEVIVISIVGFLFEIYYFMQLESGHVIYTLTENRFKFGLFISVIFLMWITYLSVKRVFEYIMPEKDKYRKILLVTESIYIIIYVAFTTYYFVNSHIFIFR